MTNMKFTKIPETIVDYLAQHATLTWHKRANLPPYFGLTKALRIPDYSHEQLLTLIKARLEGYISLELTIDKAAFMQDCAEHLAALDITGLSDLEVAWHDIEPIARRTLLHQYKVNADEHLIQSAVARMPDIISEPIAINGRFLIIETGLKSGLKIACCEADGSVRSHMILFPHEPQNLWQQGLRKLDNCVATNKVETVIVITGEGYRESRIFVKEWLATTEHNLVCYRINGANRKQMTDQIIDEHEDTLYRTVDAFIPMVIDPIATLSRISLKTLFHLPLLSVVNQTVLMTAINTQWEAIRDTIASKHAKPDPLFLTPVLRYTDLQKHQTLKGQVINRTDYGYFVDIGIVENGLLHNKQVDNTNGYQAGDIIKVTVMGINPEKQQFALTTLEKPKKARQGKPHKKAGKPASNANSAMADALKAAFTKSNE